MIKRAKRNKPWLTELKTFNKKFLENIHSALNIFLTDCKTHWAYCQSVLTKNKICPRPLHNWLLKNCDFLKTQNIGESARRKFWTIVASYNESQRFIPARSEQAEFVVNQIRSITSRLYFFDALAMIVIGRWWSRFLSFNLNG